MTDKLCADTTRAGFTVDMNLEFHHGKKNLKRRMTLSLIGKFSRRRDDTFNAFNLIYFELPFHAGIIHFTATNREWREGDKEKNSDTPVQEESG